MGRIKKLGNRFYSLNLYTGKVDFKYSHYNLLFFIVERPCSEEFIKEQALSLLMTPCRHFNFHGAYSEKWETGFDSIDSLLHPNDNDIDIAMTCQWDDFDEFVDALYLAISIRSFIPSDTYLIYDDETSYRRVINSLADRK